MEDRNDGPVRVWCDGCFDIVHYGHSNSMRQAKAMGDVLVVGVHNDADITENKGPPVFTEQERYRMIRGIKWVDEVVEGSTYWPTVDTLTENGCEFAAHGDDLSVAKNGKGPYDVLWKAQKLRFFKRTEGVSTTDIVERLLRINDISTLVTPRRTSLTTTMSEDHFPLGTGLATSRRIAQFSNNVDPKPSDKVVYTSGDFDLFHPGHLDFLEKARQHGDYLIVGLNTDEVVHERSESVFPLMNVYERTLSLLACKYVDEVVINAPYFVNKQLLDQLNVSVVCHGVNTIFPSGDDPHLIPKKLGIFKLVDSGNDLTIAQIVRRVKAQEEAFQERNAEKAKREKEFGTFESKLKEFQQIPN